MDSLAQTLERLAAAKKGLGAGQAGRDRLHDVPAFGPNPGQLRARAYVPAGLKASAPLVVVLHGCTQTAAGYDDGAGWSTLADEAGFALLFPEQQRANNGNLCFNWFEREDIAREGGEARSIRSMIDHMVSTHGLDPARIHVTGLSAGGAMAAVMLATYPELFAGGAVIAGLPYASAGSVTEALARMRGEPAGDAPELARRVRAASNHCGPWPRLSIWHGEADHTVVPSNALAMAASWALVIGTAPEASQTAVAGRHTTHSWIAPGGELVMELHSIAGMGHGTPIAPGNAPGTGRSAPHMLDVGVASTRWIAAGWGIAEREAPELGTQARGAGAEPRPQAGSVPPGRTGQFADRGPEGIRHTIEGALKAAGLMR
jgi:poly(hydroxyalkanoate) depolymerase family esterase